MSVASRRLWWAALVICAATLAGIVIGELTIDLPRVRSRRNMVIGPAGAAVWMVAGLISWRVRPDSKVGPLMVLIGWLHPAEPLIGGLGGAHVQWVLFILIPLSTLILQMALSFPNGRLTRAARITVGVAWAGWFIGAIAVALDTRAERCPACPPNPIPFADQDVSDVIYEVREPLELAAWTLTAVILALALARGERAGAARAQPDAVGHVAVRDPHRAPRAARLRPGRRAPGQAGVLVVRADPGRGPDRHAAHPPAPLGGRRPDGQAARAAGSGGAARPARPRARRPLAGAGVLAARPPRLRRRRGFAEATRRGRRPPRVGAARRQRRAARGAGLRPGAARGSEAARGGVRGRAVRAGELAPAGRAARAAARRARIARPARDRDRRRAPPDRAQPPRRGPADAARPAARRPARPQPDGRSAGARHAAGRHRRRAPGRGRGTAHARARRAPTDPQRGRARAGARRPGPPRRDPDARSAATAPSGCPRPSRPPPTTSPPKRWPTSTSTRTPAARGSTSRSRTGTP